MLLKNGCGQTSGYPVVILGNETRPRLLSYDWWSGELDEVKADLIPNIR